MRDRSSKTASYSVDAVLVTAMGNELAILLARNSGDRERWSLPWRVPQLAEGLDVAAGRAAQGGVGGAPPLGGEESAFVGGERHSRGDGASVCFFAPVPHATPCPPPVPGRV